MDLQGDGFAKFPEVKTRAEEAGVALDEACMQLVLEKSRVRPEGLTQHLENNGTAEQQFGRPVRALVATQAA